MLAAIVITLLISNSFAQFDGDFWWLNQKLEKFREEPSAPKFEDISEFDTDESTKIVFSDDNLFHREDLKEFEFNNKNTTETAKQKSDKSIQFQDKTSMNWPSEITRNFSKTNKTYETETIQMKEKNTTNKISATGDDFFEFKFPDNDHFIVTKINNTKQQKLETTNNNNTLQRPSTVTGTITLIPNKVFTTTRDDKTSATENICTFMKKADCYRLGGFSYIKYDMKDPALENRLTCCILPLRPQFISSKIYFRDEPEHHDRYKRSKDNISTAQKQRNALLLRKFGSPVRKQNIATPRPSNKVVTPSDEYIDPYWNIKNSKLQNKQGNSFQKINNKYDYNEDDYVEDYVVEVPTPGLVGLYSDHGTSNAGWTAPNVGPYGVDDSDEAYDGPSFGYSTIDPRVGNRVGANQHRISDRRPVKLSTLSDERTYNAESQTISYQSNPDFQVLQGFKLLNLVQNNSKLSKTGKKKTTERIFESDSHDAILTSSIETDYDGGQFDKNQQVYDDCGRVSKNTNRNFGNDKQIGITEKSSHPYLALVVLTKSRQSVLCYATIVHPRAAVTAADCVFGRTAPGEITLIAGAWRLDEESREEWQKRMASVHIHSKYKAGDLTYDLALLYWNRPLKLNANVQPVCLSSPHVGSYCKFFGWGGYDQALRKQSRWQLALILARSTCLERLDSKQLPNNAFCAAVQSEGTVTGIGGSLICTVGGRHSAVGVAVWRDHAVVLLPMQEWVTQAMSDIGLN